MKNFSKNVLKVTLAFSLVFFLSCSEEEAAKTMGCDTKALADQLKKLTNLGTEYTKNNSSENCKKYREAILDYAKSVKGCSLAGETVKKQAESLEDIAKGLDCE